jgi:hypothetical protein
MNTTPKFADAIDLNTRVEVFVEPNTILRNKNFVGNPTINTSELIFTFSTDGGHTLISIPMSRILLIHWKPVEDPS